MNPVAVGEEPIETTREAVAAPDELLVQFAHEMSASQADYDGPDQRCEPRYPLCLNIVAIPVDEDNNASGAPLLGVTCNISNSGIAMLFTRPVSAGPLALQFGDPRGGHVRLLMNVLRCRPVGNFFEVAGTFLSKL